MRTPRLHPLPLLAVLLAGPACLPSSKAESPAVASTPQASRVISGPIEVEEPSDAGSEDSGVPDDERFSPCDEIVQTQSLIVVDGDTLTAADFSFERTIDALVNTSGMSGSTSTVDLAETLLSGLSATSFTNPISSVTSPSEHRQGAEASLTGQNLLDDMHPIALVNRFDLAPNDGSNCGEYRMIYSGLGPSFGSPFLLIFESVLPNPTPSAGLAACAPVVQMWHDLSNPSLTATQRAGILEDFYYSGIATFDPVVTFAHYGLPLGQVRSNMFLQPPWQLREWQSGFVTNGTTTVPEFSPVTVKDNPLVEYFDETPSTGGHFGSFPNPVPSGFSSNQTAFVSHYTNDVIPNLVAFELGGGSPSSSCDIVNSIAAGFDDTFNEGESNAEPGTVLSASEDDHVLVKSASFQSSVSGAIPGAASGLTVDQVMERGLAMTCAGCHELSGNADLGNGATWPSGPFRFVHVEDFGAIPGPGTNSGLSNLLTQCFLPAREANMMGFLCESTGGGDDAGVSDGGSSDAGVPDAGGGGTSCGGPYDLACPPDEYCLPSGGTCGGTGTCEPRPIDCDGAYNREVCGCDGVTYPNECVAAQAGVMPEHDGACECNIRPVSGCCYEDDQCREGERCINAQCGGSAGVCKRDAPTDSCWDDNDCGAGRICVGAQVCPCGARCAVRDEPGRCELPPRTPKPSITFRTRMLRSSASEAETETTQSALEEAVQLQQSYERKKPGAFVPVRRSH